MAFQTIVPNQLGQAAIGTPVSTLYTVPASRARFLRTWIFCNTTPAPILVSIFIVPSPGAAGPGNALMYNAQVPGNSTVQWSGSQVMPTGATLQAQASSAGITITASGGEAT